MTVQDQLDLWGDGAAAPALVTVGDAGRILAVSRSTVYELIGAGKLEVVHIGRSVRVPLDALAAFVASLRKEPAGGAPGNTDSRAGNSAEGRCGVNS